MILSNLVLGFVTSYIGYMSPSMLNITASKIRLEKSKNEAHKFILGVLLIKYLQSSLFNKLYLYLFYLKGICFFSKEVSNNWYANSVIVNNIE